MTEESEQAITLTACGGHLVHDTARCADDVILDYLTEQREITAIECYAVRGADGVHRRYLERC